jgi:hypothetical protein
MNIPTIGPVAVSRAQPPAQSAVENVTPTKPSSAAQPTLNTVERASVMFHPLLSSETKAHLTATTQEIGPHGRSGDKIPPAQQARAAILDNPELADQPFGALVSRIARGEPLQFNSTPPSDTATTADPASVPQGPIPVQTATENPAPEAPIVVAEASTSSLVGELADQELLNSAPILADTLAFPNELIPNVS